jgi:predicted  nucleic acid-binding Zn-ribbon protein
VSQRQDALRDQLVVVRTEESDLDRELKKAEGDVDQVRARADRDQKRLDAGQVSSRQGDLEEIVLDVMERLESAQSRGAELTAQQEAAAAEATDLTAARDAATAEIDAEVELLTAQRATQASGIDDGLVTLYEKIRAQQGGVGAAELKHRRCGGCRLELNNVEIGRLRDAPEDEVLRCEECRRILVRTAESGL